MAFKVIMPKQGLQMTEGVITKWIVAEGGRCAEGEPLFEMETDKLTITMDSPATGTLLKIVHPEGDEVPITKLIAVIGEPGEDISAILADEGGLSVEPTPESSAAPVEQSEPVKAAAPERKPGGRVFSTPRARMRADERGFEINDIPPTGPNGLVIERDVLVFVPSVEPAVKASPLAKKIAQADGVSVNDAVGTGARGKVMKRDILALVAKRAEEACNHEAATRGTRVEPYRGMRKIVGDRMMESQATMAQAQHTISVDMTAAAAIREAYKKRDVKVSYNDIVLYAVSRALMEFPYANARLTDEGIVLHDYVNLGVAVAVDNGLVVPNIKDADLMTLAEIGEMSKVLSGKARSNRLSPDEMSNGTFTVTNLGMFGLDSFNAVINPPESCILAVAAIKKTPVVIDGEIAVRPMMNLTLTYDHRVTDGCPAAKFLSRIKEYIEEPVLML